MAKYYGKRGIYQAGRISDIYQLPKFTLSWYNLEEIKEYIQLLRKSYNLYKAKNIYLKHFNAESILPIGHYGVHLLDINRSYTTLDVYSIFGKDDAGFFKNVWTLRSCQSIIKIKYTYQSHHTLLHLTKNTLFNIIHKIFKDLYFGDKYEYKKRVSYRIKSYYIKLGSEYLSVYNSEAIIPYIEL